MEVLNMDETHHDFVLYNSILYNSFQEFSDLLQITNQGVNNKNRNGETPLLACLKQGRSKEFIKCLLLEGASIMVPDEEGVTPLSLAVVNNCWDIVRLLLEQCRYPQFMYETNLNYTLCAALRSGVCQVRTIIINGGLKCESVLVCITPSDSSYSCDITVREMNVFLTLLERDKYVEGSASNAICVALIRQSILLNTAVAFKTIWKRDRMQLKVAYAQPRFLHEFLLHCNFGNAECIECLRLMLHSQYARYFIQMPPDITIYEELLRYFHIKNIDKQDRILIISRTVRLAQVTYVDFIAAYQFFDFNEEVVILLQYFNVEDLPRHCYFVVFNFIVYFLEGDPKLRIENLNKLDLVAAASYRKLLNSVPEDLFDDKEVIKFKKRILNEVPTLALLSTYAFQICIQNFYCVKNVNQFNTIVENSPLPGAIKNSLCDKPPIYYG